MISAVEAVAHDLERRALGGELSPGEHLREVELTGRYGVARPTIRAALDLLVGRRLLQRARNRGVFIRSFTERDLRELYELRTILELQVCRVQAGLRSAPERAWGALARQRTLRLRAPVRAQVEAELEFHRELVSQAANSRLIAAHRDLEAEIRLCLAQLPSRKRVPASALAAAHARVLQAIEVGNAAAAETELRQHTEPAEQRPEQRADAAETELRQHTEPAV